MSTEQQKSVTDQITGLIKIFFTMVGIGLAGTVGLVVIVFLISAAWSLFTPSDAEEVERLREAHSSGFIGIPRDEEPWLQLLSYRMFRDRVREGRHEPERLKEGQSISNVKWHLGVYPLYRQDFERDGVELAIYVWEIEPGKLLETIFKDNALQRWEWDESEEHPVPPILEVEEEVYPMSADAQIRGTVLDFWVEDLFDYYGAQFAISSGQDLYFYELQLLPGGEVTSIELTEFSNEGRRFSPYSYVVDGLAVGATRPDGAKARFSTAFTGDMRKQK